jgi:DNA (cytosine-5)-methyltransferase 1
MRYLSVCSGIEAATVAWHGMGWTPVAFSEIEKFPSQVLKHHYPSVQNMGDMTKFEEWNLESVELLVGGTPCQSFSVAGLRKGLDDPRGNLMLTYGAIAKRFKPKWLVWENVPGVLSSNGGRDFGTFLGMLAELGYGFAYRVLDAQYFGVAQRRRRVFVVGCLGNWRAAAAVLFERDSLCGNPTPSREKSQDSTTTTRKGIADVCPTIGCELAKQVNNQMVGNAEAFYIPEPAQSIAFENNRRDGIRFSGELTNTLQAFAGTGGGNTPCVAIQGNLIGRDTGGPNGVGATDEGVMYTLTKADVHGVAQPIAYSIAPGAGASKDDIYVTPTDIARTLDASVNNIGNHQGGTAVMQSMAVAQPIGTDCYNGSITGDIACTMGTPGSSVNASGPTVMQHMAVRRLTPVECERLQGFPDGYTNIRENCPDGPRYKALGNSMAVPVMRWIGQRIQAVEGI